MVVGWLVNRAKRPFFNRGAKDGWWLVGWLIGLNVHSLIGGPRMVVGWLVSFFCMAGWLVNLA